MDFVAKQIEVQRWRAENFHGDNRPTLLGQMAGATGEAAEGMQLALKVFDGREKAELVRLEIADAIGDTLIYMMGACDLLGCSLEACFELAWSQVQNRTLENWK